MWFTSLALFFFAVSTGVATNVGVVFLGRSDTSTASYSSLLTQLQSSAGSSFTLQVDALNSATEAAISQSVNVFKSKGVANIFVVAHSMTGAGVVAQSYVSKNAGSVKGLVLVAGFLQRIHRPDIKTCLAKASIQPTTTLSCPLGCLADGAHDCYGANTLSFPVPVLSIGGELDGVVRISRMAEALYTQTHLSSSDFPVVLLAGMNHASLLSGAPPAAVASSDLKAELSSSEAVKAVADAVVNFIKYHTGSALAAEAKSALAQLHAAGEELVGPLLDALVNQEGSWFLTGSDDEHGSAPWAAKAQQIMAEPLPAPYSWTSSNEFHLLSDEDGIPPYYRGKHRANIQVDAASHTIKSSTVAQLRFIKLSTTDTAMGLNGGAVIEEEKLGIMNKFQAADDGSFAVSAIEIGTKLASRQLVFNLTGYDSPETLDDGSRCLPINQAAYNYALAAVSPAARARFQAHGVPMKMMADKLPVIPAGPWWIWTYLDMSMAKDASALEVTSYYAFYSLASDPYGAGNHYCKLLSPARAVEWILTDGLRSKYHL